MRLIFATLLLATIAVAQPRFEVASVKAGGDAFSVRPDRSPGRLRWTTQLCYLIGYAYGLDSARVSGPKCGAIYVIEATFPPSTSDDQLRQMIANLLTDRFQLRLRRVETVADGQALIVVKPGKAKEGPAEGESYVSAISVDAGTLAITGRRGTMSQLAATLERVLQTPFWDRTGLAGRYDFSFRFAPRLRPDLDSAAPALGTALGESLGLKPEKRKGPVETLVIEHVEEPTAN